MKKRLYKFDNLKFLLILFVVIGHFVQIYAEYSRIMRTIFIYVYSFHMPLFIFVTGLFQKKYKRYGDIPFKKILYYLVLILMMKMLLFFLDDIFEFDKEFGLLSGLNVYWYLGTVIWYMLFIPIIEKFNYKFLFVFSLLLGIFIGYDNSIGDFLYLSRTIVFFPFFLLGYYLKDKKIEVIKVCNNGVVRIFSVVVVVGFFLYCLKNLDYIYQYRPLFTGRNPYSYIFIYNCNYRNRILSYFISFTLGFSFLAVVPGIKLKVVSNMGKRTLQVYVFHMFFIKLMQGFGLFDYLHMEFGKLFVILYLIIAVVLTFFLSLRKWGNVFRLFEENIFIKNIE